MKLRTLAWTTLVLTQFSFSAIAASFSVYSGASYQPTVAPNSWAVAFGASLARTTALATLTADGQWPTTLGGTTVQVDGKPAELYYVSQGQINFLVPDGVTFGALNVIVTDVASGAMQAASVTVQNTAIGIFSSDASGTGPGAILNGVTYGPAPFLVETSQNGGSDLRTRLAIYCTGLRYAGNPTHDPTVTNVAASVTVQGQDAAGKPYNFVVEYAGVAPGYIGLDQVNIVLPAQLDGADAVSLTIHADNAASNVVTFQVNSLPDNAIRLVSLSLSASEITGGSPVTGTVSLNGLARSGGLPISLRTSLPTTQLPAVVAIPQGQVSATFTLNTTSANVAQTAIVTALAGDATLTATLQVDPATLVQLLSFSATPSSVQGGVNLSGTVGLNGPAPLGGVNVQLSSDNAAVQPPAAVTILVNNSTINFAIPTSVVATPQTANLTATLGGRSLNAQVTLAPALQLTLTDTSLTGGASTTGTVTLGTAAPTAGATITIASSATSVAQAPGTVTIPAGQTTATFPITTLTVTSARTVTITVTYLAGGLTQSAMLDVNPQAAGQLKSVSVAPTQVTGGSGATGTVTLTGPAQTAGQIIQLKTSNILAAQVPQLVTVPQGQTSATFTVTTSRVASSQAVIITATVGTISQTTVLTVN